MEAETFRRNVITWTSIRKERALIESTPKMTAPTDNPKTIHFQLLDTCQCKKCSFRLFEIDLMIDEIYDYRIAISIHSMQFKYWFVYLRTHQWWICAYKFSMKLKKVLACVLVVSIYLPFLNVITLCIIHDARLNIWARHLNQTLREDLRSLAKEEATKV